MPSLFLPLKSAGSTISFVLKGVRSQGQEWGQGCWVQKCQCGHFRGHAHWILLAMGGSVYGCGLLTPVNTKMCVCVCVCVCVCARSVTQSCLTDCDPMDCSPPVFLCPWDFSSNHTGEGCHFLLQRIFPTQGSNLGLLHCKKVLSHCATWEAINMKYINLNISMLGASPGGSVVKNPPANEGDLALILGPGRSHVPRSS